MKRAPRPRRTSRPRGAGTANWGTLKLSVVPDGATVTVDGKQVYGHEGVHVKRLGKGTHTVRVEAEGYASYERELTIEKGSTQLLDVVLKGEAPRMGLLHVHSYPWAELFVDGRFKGNTPTSPSLELQPGKHSIVLRREGYEQYEDIVEVKAGETTRAKVRLTPEPGTAVPEP